MKPGNAAAGAPQRLGRQRWLADLLAVALITLAAAWASVHWELAEYLSAEYRPEESLELDEAPGILLVLALCLLWYAWRRIRETRAALARSTRAEQELAASFADKQRLLRRYAEVQEQERTRLSRELHDELGQYLNAIRIDAVSLKRMPQPDAVAETAGSIARNAEHLHGVVARLIRQLRPVGLDELGLEAALEHCLEAWRGRLPATVLRLSCEGVFEDCGESFNLAVYRMVQEGLTNVSKHAQAAHVDVRLTRADGGGTAVVDVADDGRGMDPLAAARGGFGLIGMRERIEALGGELRIDAAAGRGCRLQARIPLQHPARPAHA